MRRRPRHGIVVDRVDGARDGLADGGVARPHVLVSNGAAGVFPLWYQQLVAAADFRVRVEHLDDIARPAPCATQDEEFVRVFFAGARRVSPALVI